MADDKKAKKEDDHETDGAATEGAPAEGGADEAPKKKKLTPKKLVLFVVLPLLLLIGGGAGAYYMGLLDKFLPHKAPDCEQVKEGDKDFEECEKLKAPVDAALPGVFLPMPDMIVNLNTSGKQPRFLKVALKLEIESDLEQKKLESLMPRVVDQFQMYLRELRLEDLRGTSGIYRMKIELLSRVRAAAPDVKVRDVLFQEILVQ